MQASAVRLNFALLLFALGPWALQAQGPSQEIVLHGFEGFEIQGAYPVSGVILDAAGNLYGATYSGGGSINEGPGAGVAFSVTAAGDYKILHRFTGGSDGAYPNALTLGADGNLYGSTLGLTFDSDTLFKLDKTGNFTLLYTFRNGKALGASDPSSVTRDTAGNLYGTTSFGGTEGTGTIFKLDTSNHLTVLYSFLNGNDGGNPRGGVTLDPAGNLYGTTTSGGSSNCGVLYRLDTQGHETTLHSFGANGDGCYPAAAVIFDGAGNIYGTTVGSKNTFDAGVIYKVDTNGKETVLYAFTGGADGGYPYSGVTLDAQGDLYGTTAYGGSSGSGVVYRLSPSGQETVLDNLPAPAAQPPAIAAAAVALGANGNLFSTSETGGTAELGFVFELTPAGQQTTLFNFPASSTARGSNPSSGVVLGKSGSLFGTTTRGGPTAPGRLDNPCGVVYELTPAGQEKIIYSFTGGVSGCDLSGLLREATGNLYGTAFSDGPGGASTNSDLGLVYMLDPTGNETVLYSFQGGTSDGAGPTGGLIRDAAGNFYGTTEAGGAENSGVVYKLDPSGNETVLYSFLGIESADGSGPEGLVRDPAGNLYGNASNGGLVTLPLYKFGAGLVYEISPAGIETVLHAFTGGADGAYPTGVLLRDAQGNLFGTTQLGGAHNAGVVFELSAEGVESVLYSFQGGSDGSQPLAGVIRDAAGNFYGTTQQGGAEGYGVVFKLDTSGAETVLYSFTANDGQFPIAPLTLDAAGNLYGTTYSGGPKVGGVVFKLLAAGDGN